MPLAITANEDRTIKFIDLNSSMNYEFNSYSEMHTFSVGS